MMASALKAPLPPDAVHVCVDMQRMFAEETPWHAPWMPRVLPKVERLVARRPGDTVFTRFIPAEKPGDGQGTWKSYWESWAQMTRSRLPAGMIDLVPSLAAFAPPGEVIDKTSYSPWQGMALDQSLEAVGATALVVSGTETDICVLATILGAVDRGYRTIVARDAVCSSSDEAHEAMMTLLHERYSHHVEMAEAEEILSAWTAPSPLGRDGKRKRRVQPVWTLG